MFCFLNHICALTCSRRAAADDVRKINASEAGAHLVRIIAPSCHCACCTARAFNAISIACAVPHGLHCRRSRTQARPWLCRRRSQQLRRRQHRLSSLLRCITLAYLCVPLVHCHAASLCPCMCLVMPSCSQSSALQAKHLAAERRLYTLRQRNEPPCSSLPLHVSFAYSHATHMNLRPETRSRSPGLCH